MRSRRENSQPLSSASIQPEEGINSLSETGHLSVSIWSKSRGGTMRAGRGFGAVSAAEGA
jgi:hypothetical protein